MQMFCIYNAEMEAAGRRETGLAVLASLAAHGSLLWMLGHSAGNVAQRERAVGTPGLPGPFTEVTVLDQSALARSAASKRTPLRTEDPLAVPDAAAKMPSEPTTPRTPPTPLGNAAATGAPGATGQGGANGTSTSYRARLHAYLDNAKAYPQALRELRLSGTVVVRFRVAADGSLHDISLPEQASPPPLKNEALRFLRRVRQVPSPPAQLRAEQLQFEVPLRYEPGA